MIKLFFSNKKNFKFGINKIKILQTLYFNLTLKEKNFFN